MKQDQDTQSHQLNSCNRLPALRQMVRACLITFTITIGNLGAQAMSKQDSMDFEKFEKVKSDQAGAAQAFLSERFPMGSDVQAALQYVQKGGAQCEFIQDRGSFYLCQYSRPGHGLMALVSTIDWKVVVYTDNNGKFIERISVGRGASGP